MQLFGFTEAAISTVEHDVHRIRRGAMSRMFSKDSVRRLEPIMQQNLEKLFTRMDEFKESGRPLGLLPMFSAFTNDLIAEYAFGISYNWLEAPEFNKSFFHFVRFPPELLDGAHLGRLLLSMKQEPWRSSSTGGCH